MTARWERGVGSALALTVLAVALIVTGCGTTAAPAPATVTVEAPALAVPDAPTLKTVTLPDVVGRNGAIARDTLRALGLTKVDFAADAASGRQMVLLPENWTVTKMEPQAGTQVRADQTVVITMTK